MPENLARLRARPGPDAIFNRALGFAQTIAADKGRFRFARFNLQLCPVKQRGGTKEKQDVVAVSDGRRHGHWLLKNHEGGRMMRARRPQGGESTDPQSHSRWVR